MEQAIAKPVPRFARQEGKSGRQDFGHLVDNKEKSEPTRPRSLRLRDTVLMNDRAALARRDTVAQQDAAMDTASVQ
jgi:hypothetical protein